jgi:hypothetical protein
MTTKVKLGGVAKFKDDVKKWEALSRKFAKFGASDTEPDAVFQWCLRDKVNGVDVRIPQSARDWQLYSSMQGVGLAASHLTKALVRCLDSLGQVTVSEQKELREFLNGYLWRC